MFPASPDDGWLSRLVIQPVNRLFDGVMERPASTRCYLQVWDVEATDGEELVLVSCVAK
jgi:hypothetical protein